MCDKKNCCRMRRKKKKKNKPKTSPHAVTEKCQELLFHSFLLLSITFSLVFLSLHHLLPIRFILISILSSLSLLLWLILLSLSFSLPPSILSSSLLSCEGSQVSAVTALVQGIMVCNSLPAPLSWSEAHSCTSRDVISVCVFVRRRPWRVYITLSSTLLRVS